MQERCFVSVDRTKVLEAAQKHVAKGNLDKAIVEYQKIIAEDSRDVRTLLRIGDLYTRKGARVEACRTYERVAQQYAEQGFFLKAVAVYKQVLKLDPDRLETSLRLADMYRHLGLVSDALSTYEQLSDAYNRAGNFEKSLEVLGQMSDLDAQNVPVRIKYAEALSKTGRNEEAALAFEAGATLLKEQNRIDDYIKVAERLLYHRPNDMRVAQELAAVYIERNDPKRALAKLQVCFKTDPRDVNILSLLALAFHSLGQTAKTISVYREIARLHQEAGNAQERVAILQKILALDPSDAESRKALDSLSARSAPKTPSARAPQPSMHPFPRPAPHVEEEVASSQDDIAIDADEEILEPDEEDVVIVEDAPAPKSGSIAAIPSRSSRAPARISHPPDAHRDMQVARLLAECEVFMRYGLKGKVIEQLSHILELAPEHIEVREKLRDLYLEQGNLEGAVAQLLYLGDVFAQDDPETAGAYFDHAAELSPDNPDVLARINALTGAFESASEDEIFFVADEEGTNASSTGISTVGSLRPAPESSESLEEPYIDEWPEETTAAITEASAVTSMRSSRPAQEENLSQDTAVSVQPPATSVRPSLHPTTDIEEILDETEFFIAQGLFHEARGTLKEALLGHPNHPILTEKLLELEGLASEAGQTGNTANEDTSFLLAEKLAEEFQSQPEAASDVGAAVLDVDSVFAQFKKGIQEQVPADDSDTHFDLGIAYKEMGLIDDAIHEFQLSTAHPARQCNAHTMIGLCYLEKGDPNAAVGEFKKGLYAPQKSEREELGLYFELGSTYEQLRDLKEALYYYQKVQKIDPDFREVGTRIAAITEPEAASARQSFLPSMDDVDRAFDDLMGDDNG